MAGGGDLAVGALPTSDLLVSSDGQQCKDAVLLRVTADTMFKGRTADNLLHIIIIKSHKQQSTAREPIQAHVGIRVLAVDSFPFFLLGGSNS